MAHLLLLFITLILFPFSTSSQSTGKISVGASITATENSTSWPSPFGDFAFGFQQLQNNSNLFVLAIWFAKIPDKTIAWFDRSSYPVPRGSILSLESADGLVLRDPRGNPLFNTSGLGAPVAYALMNDTGNLVLFGSDSSLLWQSFENPADTILPTQTIEIGGTLISRKTETDFSYGRFYAGMNANGNFVLNTKSIFSNLDFDDEYYNSQSTSGIRVVFDKNSASISVVRKNGEQIKTILSSSLTPSENYYRAALDFDGVFALYSYPRKINSNSKWVAAGTLPDNICMSIDGQKGSGACGFNNVCRLKNSRPDCQCPQGFSLVDLSNPYGDCKSNFTENCIQGGQDEYVLLEISDVDWPFNDYEQRNLSTFEECKSGCKSDYFCGAAIFRSQSCWKKRLPLSNGRVDTSLGATAFLKVRKSS